MKTEADRLQTKLKALMDYQERQTKLMDKKEDEVALLNSELSNANSNLAAANGGK